MHEAIHAFLLGFPALFSIVNPLAGAFIFREMTAGRSVEQRGILARKVAIYALLMMMGALWAGSFVLAFFGITLAALRIAGGMVVALTAWNLLNRPEEHEADKQEQMASGHRHGRHRVVPADHAHHRRSRHDRCRGGAQRQSTADVRRVRRVLLRHDRRRTCDGVGDLDRLWLRRSHRTADGTGAAAAPSPDSRRSCCCASACRF